MAIKNKVFVICTVNKYASISSSIEDCFDVVNLSYTVVPKNKLFWYFIKVFKLFKIVDHIKFNQAVKEYIEKRSNSDKLLIIKGSTLSKKNIESLKKLKGNIYYWSTDSFIRYKFQKVISELSFKSFIHDGQDCEESDNLIWRPYGYDQNLFYPDISLEKDIDILFVGNIYGKRYKTRFEYLKLLLESDIPSEFKCHVVGKPGKRNFFERLKMQYPNITFHGKMSMNELSFLLRKSKICINILQDDGKYPINPMFFAIQASGANMVTENRDYLSDFYDLNSNIVLVKSDTFIVEMKNLLVRFENLNTANSVEKIKKYSLREGLNELLS